MPLATAIKSPTPVADKNLAASKPTDTPTGPHKAKMVTPTYTVVLLQVAIMLEPRAKPAGSLCAVGIRDGGLHGCHLEPSMPACKAQKGSLSATNTRAPEPTKSEGANSTILGTKVMMLRKHVEETKMSISNRITIVAYPSCQGVPKPPVVVTGLPTTNPSVLSAHVSLEKKDAAAPSWKQP